MRMLFAKIDGRLLAASDAKTAARAACSAVKNWAGDGGPVKLIKLSLLLGFAAFLGVATVFLPWFLFAALLVAVAYPLLVFKAPWLAFAVYVAAIFVAPGQKTADGLTVAVLLIFALRCLVGRRIAMPALLLRPFFVFIAAVAIAGAIGLFVRRYPLSMIYGDGRGFVYWLWLPLLYALVAEAKLGVSKLGRVIAFIAGLIGVFAIIQYVTGVQLIAAGRVAGLDAGAGSATRVQMQGFLFVSFVIVWSLIALVHKPRIWVWLGPVLLLLLFALYVNFGRALWFWTFCAIVLSIVVAGVRRGWAIALLIALAGLFGTINLLLVKPDVAASVVERMVSLRDEGGARSSYGWRRLENAAALPHIIKSPLIGLGMGAEYRPWLAEIARFEEHTRYIHNSYFFIAVKAGLPAVVALVLLICFAWRAGWRYTRSYNVPSRSLRLAALACMPPFLGICVTQPELVTPMSVLLFCSLVTLMVVGSVAEAPDAST